MSTLTLQVTIGMTSKTFGRRRRIVSFEDIALAKPVFGGDTLYAEFEILATADEPGDPDVGRLSVVTRGVNQRGEVVCATTYTALVDRADPAEMARREDDERLASHRVIAPNVYLEHPNARGPPASPWRPSIFAARVPMDRCGSGPPR